VLPALEYGYCGVELMGIFSRERKLSAEEINQCMDWLDIHYRITTFQEKEADLYNNALVKLGNDLTTDKLSGVGMLQAAKRLADASQEMVARTNYIKFVPEPASRAHLLWMIVFSDYMMWATAQYAAIQALIHGRNPIGERVVELFKKSEESTKQALKAEKKLLEHMHKNGFTVNDLHRLNANAAEAIAQDKWLPS